MNLIGLKDSNIHTAGPLLRFSLYFKQNSTITPDGSENISPFTPDHGKKLSGKGKNLSLP